MMTCIGPHVCEDSRAQLNDTPGYNALYIVHKSAKTAKFIHLSLTCRCFSVPYGDNSMYPLGFS